MGTIIGKKKKKKLESTFGQKKTYKLLLKFIDSGFVKVKLHAPAKWGILMHCPFVSDTETHSIIQQLSLVKPRVDHLDLTRDC